MNNAELLEQISVLGHGVNVFAWPKFAYHAGPAIPDQLIAMQSKIPAQVQPNNPRLQRLIGNITESAYPVAPNGPIGR
jgi:hypothetical protein